MLCLINIFSTSKKNFDAHHYANFDAHHYANNGDNGMLDLNKPRNKVIYTKRTFSDANCR